MKNELVQYAEDTYALGRLMPHKTRFSSYDTYQTLFADNGQVEAKTVAFATYPLEFGHYLKTLE